MLHLLFLPTLRSAHPACPPNEPLDLALALLDPLRQLGRYPLAGDCRRVRVVEQVEELERVREGEERVRGADLRPAGVGGGRK